MKKDNIQKNRVRFLTGTAYVLVILAIVYCVFKYLLNLVMPFFIGLIIASLARPVALKLSGAGSSRTAATRAKYNVMAVLSVFMVFLLMVGLLAIIAVPLINFIASWIARVPDFYNYTLMPALTSLLAAAQKIPDRVGEPFAGIIQSVIPNVISSVGSTVTEVSGAVLGWVSSIATKLPSMLLSALISVIASIFIVLDYDHIVKFLQVNLRSNVMHVIVTAKDSLMEIVWQFLKSYALIFVITVVEIAVGLAIIGKSNPLLFAVIIAVFDAFPIVGAGTILMPWAVTTMITSGFWKGASMLLLFLVVVIVRQIIEPRIVGKQVGLRPIVTLFCMYIGTKLFGVIGLFGLPILTAIIIDLNERPEFHIFNDPDEFEDEEDEGEESKEENK